MATTFHNTPPGIFHSKTGGVIVSTPATVARYPADDVCSKEGSEAARGACGRVSCQRPCGGWSWVWVRPGGEVTSDSEDGRESDLRQVAASTSAARPCAGRPHCRWCRGGVTYPHTKRSRRPAQAIRRYATDRSRATRWDAWSGRRSDTRPGSGERRSHRARPSPPHTQQCTHRQRPPRRGHPMMQRALWQGLLSGAAGVTVMTPVEKLEQSRTNRPNFHVPARVLQRLIGMREHPGDSHCQ